MKQMNSKKSLVILTFNLIQHIMADQSSGREKEERKKLVLSHIGRELRKTLVLVETRTKKEVVDIIVDIFDPEFIVENRNALFALAVEGFKQQNSG